MKRAVVNIGWLLLDKFMRLSIGLLITMWLAQYLGPTQFGQMNFVTSVVAIFAVFATLGLKGVVVKELVNQPTTTFNVLGSAFLLKVLGALVTYALLIAFSFFVLPSTVETKWFIAIVGVSILFKTSEVVSFYFEAKVESKYVVWVENCAFVIASGIKLGLLWFEAPLIAFFIAIVVEALLMAVALLFIYQRQVSSLMNWQATKRQMSSLLSQSWPLVISSAAWVVYTRVDQVMLGTMLDAQAVGLYAAAVRLTEIANIVPMIITFSMVPLIMPLRADNKDLYQTKFQQVYDLAVGLMILGAVLTLFIATDVVGILYGDAYAASASVLKIHVWTCVFIAMATVSGKYLLNEGLQKITMQRHLFGVCLNIPMNYVAIPLYGIEGAAGTSLISLAISNYLFDAFSSCTRLCFIQKSKSLLIVGGLETLWKRLRT
ncbi:MAG: flippase [Thalassotalea sp.]|nr:flippase [Thalassotalea sp.]